jgi:hypothetical protein
MRARMVEVNSLCCCLRNWLTNCPQLVHQDETRFAEVLYYLQASSGADEERISLAIVRLFGRLDEAEYLATSKQYRSCFKGDEAEVVAVGVTSIIKIVAACEDEDRGDGWFHIARKSSHLVDWLAWLGLADIDDDDDM